MNENSLYATRKTHEKIFEKIGFRAETGVRILLAGGNLNNGANAGPRIANANNAPGNSNANIGSRLNLTLNSTRTEALPLGKTHHLKRCSGSSGEGSATGQAL